MEAPLLSAALIARNEERFLGTCLDSLAGLADEVIIVDTGSTDATPRIAEERGITVHSFPWVDDFSAARNRALDLARGEWILYIDADERVRCGAANARKRLTDQRYIGFHVLLAPRQGLTPYWVLRLFRNHPSIRFRGIIHENIWPALTEYRAAFGGKVGSTRLELDHFGYEDHQSRKDERNLPLLERALQQDPERVYSWCHMAEILCKLGNEEAAVKAWRTAMDIARRHPKPLVDDSLPWSGLIGFEMNRRSETNRGSGTNAGSNAGALLDEALARFPDNLQFHWLKGRLLMNSERFEEAVPYFERLARAGETQVFSHHTAYDPRIMGVLPYESLATCHFRLRSWAEAVRYYDLALGCEPGRMDLRAKRAVAETKAAAGTALA